MKVIIQYLITSYLNTFNGISKLTLSIIFSIFINAMGQMFLLFIAFYLSSINYSAYLISAVLTSYNIGGLVGSYAGGELIEKLKTKILSISLFSSSIFLILIPLLNSPISKIITVFLLGLTHSAFKPASIYFLVNSMDTANKTRLLGFRRVAVNLGMSFASIIGGWLSTKGYHYIFFVESGFSLLSLFTLLFCFKSYSSPTNLQHKKLPQTKIKHVSKNIILIYIILFLNMFVFAQLFFSYPLFLRKYYNITSDGFARLFTISSIIIILTEIPILTYLKKYSQLTIVGLGSILLCNGISILIFSSTTYIVYFSVILWTIGEIIFFPSCLNLILFYSKNKQGRNIGLYQFTYSLGLLLGPNIGGILYNLNHNFLWYGCILVSLVSCIILFALSYYNHLQTCYANTDST